jgi:hypothetical protein
MKLLKKEIINKSILYKHDDSFVPCYYIEKENCDTLIDIIWFLYIWSNFNFSYNRSIKEFENAFNYFLLNVGSLCVV